ncbi:MAG: PorT family protein [Cyclobacteriaceae bacterium]|nr:PorT family protein [Cyclobacteriaceae bacterium]
MKQLLLAVFVAGSSMAQAQFLLPRAGATFSWVQFDDPSLTQTEKQGFTFGLGYNFKISNRISIQPEFNFIQKGFSSSETYTVYPYGGGYYDVSVMDKKGLNYLQLPLLGKVTLGNKIKVFLNAGPALGFGLSGKGSYSYNTEGVDGLGDPISANVNIDYKVIFKEAPLGYEGEDDYIKERIDVSAQFGLGISLFDKVILETRYGHSISSFNTYPKMQHRLWQITIGVPIRF